MDSLGLDELRLDSIDQRFFVLSGAQSAPKATPSQMLQLSKFDPLLTPGRKGTCMCQPYTLTFATLDISSRPATAGGKSNHCRGFSIF